MNRWAARSSWWAMCVEQGESRVEMIPEASRTSRRGVVAAVRLRRRPSARREHGHGPSQPPARPRRGDARALPRRSAARVPRSAPPAEAAQTTSINWTCLPQGRVTRKSVVRNAAAGAGAGTSRAEKAAKPAGASRTAKQAAPKRAGSAATTMPTKKPATEQPELDLPVKRRGARNAATSKRDAGQRRYKGRHVHTAGNRTGSAGQAACRTRPDGIAARQGRVGPSCAGEKGQRTFTTGGGQHRRIDEAGRHRSRQEWGWREAAAADLKHETQVKPDRPGGDHTHGALLIGCEPFKPFRFTKHGCSPCSRHPPPQQRG